MAHPCGSIGMVEFLQAMGDPERAQRCCWVMAQGFHCVQDCGLALGVQQRRRFVEQEQVGVAGEGSGYGQVRWPPLRV